MQHLTLSFLVLLNTTTIGCALYTSQPSANNHPTTATVVPGSGASTPGPSFTVLWTNSSLSPPSSLPTGASVVTETINGQKISETRASTTYTEFADIETTKTSTTLGASEISSSAVLPISVSVLPWDTADTYQVSGTDAFANKALSETTIIAGGVTEYWSKATFADLSTITAPTTITTPVVQTNQDGSQFTISAAIIIVGPGGVWWNGGTGGWGLHGPSCIWPFCPPGPPGGGDVGGDGSGTSLNDPNNPNSPEKPSDPDDKNSKSQAEKNSDPSCSTTSQSSSPSVSSSSCSTGTIASDCLVICSKLTSTLSQSCSTTCYSTITDCGATGTTQYSTASGASCTKPAGWINTVDGDDFPDYQPLGTAGIAAPEALLGRQSGFSSATDSFSSATDGSSSATDGSKLTNQFTATSASPSPLSTNTIPANTPSQSSVLGCALVASTSGTSAYCNCGGTTAPTLSPNMNCDYTIQPTSSYNPAILLSPSSATLASTYATGKCNVHIWEGLGYKLTNPQVVIDVNITDANGIVIGYGAKGLDWAQTFEVDSKLPYVMEITPQTGISNNRRSAKASLRKRLGSSGSQYPWPLFEKGSVNFAIGSQSWDSTSSQCSVGAWDNGNVQDYFGALILGDGWLPNRQIDCKFDCPGPNSKKRALTERHEPLIEWDDESKRDIKKQDLKNHLARDPSLTTNNDPSPVDEQLFNTQALDPRTNHGTAWVKYAPSGARYYQAWQDKAGDDAVYQCDFMDDFDVILPIKFVSPARSIQQTLQAAGYGIGREYYAIIASGPKNRADGPFAEFQNTISVTQGVFLASSNNRGALPSDPNDPMYNPAFPNGRQPVPWQFSSVAWWMWTKTVLTQNTTWAEDPTQADYSTIKSFWRREVNNLDTKSILDEAFAGKDITSIQTWTPEDTDQDTNPIWALMGSPNGNGILYFLTDNKVALKGKGIVSISATTVQDSDEHYYYTMWASFT